MPSPRQTFAAFFSYVQLLDEQDGGRLSKFRERLEREVQLHTGEPFTIFQDRKDISWGQEWKKRIDSAIDGSTYLIAIISPGYFKSEYCRKEFERFLQREKQLGRSELIVSASK
jgi:hypothetical protein